MRLTHIIFDNKRLLTVSVVLGIASLLGGASLAATLPTWTAPVGTPPQNNTGQPPTTDTLTDYVRKSKTYSQSVKGPVGINQDAAETLRTYFGASGSTIAIQAQDGIPANLPAARIGVRGYGSQYGLYGRTAGNTSLSAGVVGQSSLLTSDDFAATFEGPIRVRTDAIGSNPGNLSLDGTVIADNGFLCTSATECALTGSYWMKATNNAGGTAVYGEGTTNPGISVNVGLIGSNVNGPAVKAVSENSFSLVGFVNDGSGGAGIYGKAGGTVTSNTYVGIAGFRYASALGTGGSGIRGTAQGGFGSPDYDPGAGFKYDYTAGIRACVKDSAGNAINRYGIRGVATGNSYAGYFGPLSGGLGDIMIAGDPEEGGSLVKTFDGDGKAYAAGHSHATVDVLYTDPSTNVSYLYILGQAYLANGHNAWRIEKRNVQTGALDLSFGGGDGIVEDDIYDTVQWEWYDIPMDAFIEGQYLYIVGTDSFNGNNEQSKWRIEKRNISTGALDSGFGSGGVITHGPTNDWSLLHAVATDGTHMYLAGMHREGALIEKRLLSNGALCTGTSCDGAAFAGTSCADNQTDTPMGCNQVCIALNTPLGCDTNYSQGQIYLRGSDDIFDIKIDTSVTPRVMYIIGETAGGAAQYMDKRRLDNGQYDTSFDGDGRRIISGFYPRHMVIRGLYAYLLGSNTAGEGTAIIEKRRLTDGALCTSSACGASEAFGSTGSISVTGSVYSSWGASWNIMHRGNPLTLDGKYLYFATVATNTWDTGGWRIDKRLATTGALCTQGNCGTDGFFTSNGYIVDNEATSDPWQLDIPFGIVTDSRFLYIVGGTNNMNDWRVEKRRKAPDVDLFTIGSQTMTEKTLKTLLCKANCTQAAQCTGSPSQCDPYFQYCPSTCTACPCTL